MQEMPCPPLDRHWTAEEGAAIVAEWRESGLSASAFVRDRGFGLHRLRYWSSRTEAGGSGRPDFVVVPLEPRSRAKDEGSDSNEGPMIEISAGDDVFVRIPITADRLLITEALKAVLEGSR